MTSEPATTDFIRESFASHSDAQRAAEDVRQSAGSATGP
jgi:hypothetical protein